MNEPDTDRVPDPMTRRMFIAAGAAGAAAVAAPVVLGEPGSAVSGRASAFGYPPPDMRGVYVRDIAFPVSGSVNWVDSYGSCRGGCTRRHEGQDIFGRKGQRLLACVSGTIVALRYGGRSGNSLSIRSDANGWYYSYLHINNDSPGTDNGSNRFRGAFAPGVQQWAHVRRGQHVAYMGDSGNAEGTSPHLHFEIRKPAGSVWNAQAVNAKYSLRAAGSSRRSSGSSGSSGSSRSASVPSGSRAMRRGDRGGNVAALQRALNFGTGTRLVADGSFGPLTERAVKNLQKWFRLVVDGVYGPRSQFALQVGVNNKR